MAHFLKRAIVDLEESARIALEQLRVHKMRSLLTALGVIIGVWAVILIGVGISGLDNGFDKSMAMIGPNHFYVEKWPWRDPGDDWQKFRNRPNMETRYAAELNEIFESTPNSGIVIAVPVVSINRNVQRGERSIPRASLAATNADFAFINTAEIEQGRFFTATENAGAQNVVVLGSGIIKALYPDDPDAVLGSTVKIANANFTVIGTLAEQGAFLGMQSFDNVAIIPLLTVRKFFTGYRNWNGTTIRIVKREDVSRDDARDEIIGAMRRVRSLMPGEEDDFEVNASDAIENTLGPVKTNIAIGGFFITGLSLFVGAIGIMNITFVSVKERTKEIGTRRAIGARRSSILTQFLIEAVSVCLLGGVVGMLLAFISKLALDRFFPAFPSSFSVDLMLLAFFLSVATGILSGLIPAIKASQLDPATALRHE